MNEKDIISNSVQVLILSIINPDSYYASNKIARRKCMAVIKSIMSLCKYLEPYFPLRKYVQVRN